MAIIGDSITVLSAGAIEAALGGVEKITAVGEIGYDIGQMLPYARTIALTVPNTVVINLGTNDAAKGVPPARSAVQLDSMLAQFPQATRVLVTVNTHFDTAECSARAQALNEHIRSVGYPVADWNAAVSDELAAGLPNGPVTSDTIHPTAYGQKILANLIAGALKSAS